MPRHYDSNDTTTARSEKMIYFCSSIYTTCYNTTVQYRVKRLAATGSYVCTHFFFLHAYTYAYIVFFSPATPADRRKKKSSPSIPSLLLSSPLLDPPLRTAGRSTFPSALPSWYIRQQTAAVDSPLRVRRGGRAAGRGASPRRRVPGPPSMGLDGWVRPRIPHHPRLDTPGFVLSGPYLLPAVGGSTSDGGESGMRRAGGTGDNDGRRRTRRARALVGLLPWVVGRALARSFQRGRRPGGDLELERGGIRQRVSFPGNG